MMKKTSSCSKFTPRPITSQMTECIIIYSDYVTNIVEH